MNKGVAFLWYISVSQLNDLLNIDCIDFLNGKRVWFITLTNIRSKYWRSLQFNREHKCDKTMMRLIHCIGVFYSLAFSILAASQSSSVVNAAARSSAAQANWPFYTVCLADINTNLPAYNSYMADNNMELPQAIGDYYFHLANLPNTADLEADIASSFPFTHFQTFITGFPWYSSMLQKASVSTVYLPQDFISGSTATSGSQFTGVAATNSGETTVATGTSTKNEAISINPGYLALFLVQVGGFLA